jgi:haloalkane dehalogenase
VGWPSTILWGDRDPALGEDRRRAIEEALDLEANVIPAKHFLQEDQAPAVVDAIARVSSSA